MPDYAGIHLLDTPYCIDNTFDYYIPPDLRREILCGDFVTVPFGTANKTKIGIVVELRDEPENKNIVHKSLTGVCDKTLSLSDEALKLCFFLKEQTLCTVGEAVRAVVPASSISKLEEYYEFCENAIGVILDDEDAPTQFIAEYIKKKKTITLAALKSKFGPAAEPAVRSLLNAGVLRKDVRVVCASEKQIEVFSLSVAPKDVKPIVLGKTDIRLRSQSHVKILEYLRDQTHPVPAKQITDELDVTLSQIKALCDKCLVNAQKRTVDRGLELLSYEYDPKEIILNEEQRAAYEKLCSLCDAPEAAGALLHGVTGSGKTSVMMKTIDHVLESGKGVIVLLPEIALTPQSLEIFCSRYGDRVAIIHSGLSAGERFDTYRRIKNGDADMVIGTRSAVFAPIQNLGLIIIDEEQEHTYKSDMDPKYHTRDVARFRAAYHGGVMLLASATPSFESYKKALDGKYTLIELTHRYGGAKLPTAVVADMRTEISAGNTSPLGDILRQKLFENTQKKNQSILFINRRGYNNFISCRSCGEAIKCPQCSVSMTYHTSTKSYDSGYLACHWCGRKMPLPSTCPYCSSEHLARMGYGTQRIEQELGTLLPDSTVLRMDTDTTGEKSAYEELLGKFRRHEADVLLGTQMVTKGHDFPDVTLVGVLLADSSLYLDDYRAAERTFAMLTQVIGRAGRAKKEGVAVIQTNNPDNECIRLACAQDYKAFYQSEIKLRKLLVFPPFCDIALMTLTCSDEKELVKASGILSAKLSELVKGEYSDVPLVVFGPFEAPVYKVENKYRMRMVLKCRANKRCRAMLSEVLKHFSSAKANKLSLSVDINPTNL